MEGREEGGPTSMTRPAESNVTTASYSVVTGIPAEHQPQHHQHTVRKKDLRAVERCRNNPDHYNLILSYFVE